MGGRGGLGVFRTFTGSGLYGMDQSETGRLVEMIMGHGHWRQQMLRIGILVDEPTCRK